MTTAIFVQRSEPVLTRLETERGYLPVEGVHAIAGVDLRSSPFDPDIPFDLVGHRSWLQRQARFWLSMAINPDEVSNPWHLSYELRVASHGGDPKLRRVSLWAKTFAAKENIALDSAFSLAETIAVLCPQECEPRLVSTIQEFEHLWGRGDLPWLVEMRRAHQCIENNREAEGSQSIYWLSDWSADPESWREVWDLINRIPAGVWISVGVCPTRLFEAEENTLREWASEEAEATSSDQDNLPEQASSSESLRWRARLQSWTTQAFLVRLRIGGEARAGRWIARAVAGSLLDWNSKTRSAIRIVTPASNEDWQSACHNWQWADFQQWGDIRLPGPLRRMRYLCDAREAGLLAGVWA